MCVCVCVCLTEILLHICMEFSACLHFIVVWIFLYFCCDKERNKKHCCINLPRAVVLKGSYDAISSFAFSLECYKLIVHRYDP